MLRGKDVLAIETLAEDRVENHCEIISFLSQQVTCTMRKVASGTVGGFSG